MNHFESFGQLDDVALWYLDEIVYCMVHYKHLSKKDAIQKVNGSAYLADLLRDEQEFLQVESPFYWAMGVLQKGTWWHDELLSAQSEDYRAQKRRPPLIDS